MRRPPKQKTVILILSILVVVESALLIYFGLSRPKKKPEIIPAAAARGKIAIVLDDWGYNFKNMPLLNQIKYPLTLSVLPNLPYSKKVSEEASRRGFEVILHLPMEPHEKYRLEKNTILSSMNEAAMTNILKKGLASIRNVSGASNHMGSRATEDARAMGIIFKELKKQGLYFLDSRVSGGSVCLDLAQKMSLKFARRDVFLDNQEEPEYIRQQVYKLKLRANLHGEAIGVGHDRRVTLEVLREVMPEMEKEGYKFVFVSELVK